MSAPAEKKINPNQIFYIGNDLSFVGNLRDYLDNLSSKKFDFKVLAANDEKKIQNYIHLIMEEKPKIVLIDFSQNLKATTHLCRVWERTNFHIDIPIVGICDNENSTAGLIEVLITSKVKCVQLKSAELDSIAYNILKLGFKDIKKQHEFALAKMDDLVHAFYPAKASLINENFLKIESDLKIQPKQVVRINNFWHNSQVIKSNLFMCVDQTQANIYYSYKYQQIFQMAHVDPVNKAPDMEVEEFDKKNEERKELVVESKHRLNKWLKTKSYDSVPKFLKALVIDKKCVLYKDMPLTDSYDFVLRVQPYLENAKRELINIRPNIIVYNLEDVTKEEIEANPDIAHTFNESRMLQHVIKTASDVLSKNPPIIIVFNAGEYTTDYLKKVFKYPNILAVSEEIQAELVLKMINMLKTKISSSLPTNKKGEIYLDKASNESYIEIATQIEIKGLSENDVYFSTEQIIKPGTVLKVNLPIPMFITVVEPPERAKIDSSYYAIIHGIGELERKRLRRFINGVFFRSLDASKEKEREQIEALKEKYQNKENEKVQNTEANLREKALDDKAKKVIDQL